MSELLPCPFCNGGTVDLATLAGKFCVQCSECEASGPWVDKPSRAIDAWNRRAALAAQPGAVGEPVTDSVCDALIQAWTLGQYYHGYNDRDDQLGAFKARVTHTKFVELLDKTRAVLAAAPTEAKPAQTTEATQQASGERPMTWPQVRDELSRLSMIAGTAMHQTNADKRNILEDLADALANLSGATLSTPAQQDAVDAERFRFLTDVAEGSFWDRIRPMCKEDLILAIDAAIGAPKGGV